MPVKSPFIAVSSGDVDDGCFESEAKVFGEARAQVVFALRFLDEVEGAHRTLVARSPANFIRAVGRELAVARITIVKRGERGEHSCEHDVTIRFLVRRR